jgi:hypothetical protein
VSGLCEAWISPGKSGLDGSLRDEVRTAQAEFRSHGINDPEIVLADPDGCRPSGLFAHSSVFSGHALISVCRENKKGPTLREEVGPPRGTRNMVLRLFCDHPNKI